MVQILLVDDNEKIRNLMGIYLKREGYTVIHAADGEQALDRLAEMPVDLAVVDIMMPNMDGFELTRSLREAGYEMPILIVTAKDSVEDKREGFTLGADDYITKPFDMEELTLRVKALLRRSKIFSESKITIGDVTLDYNSLEVIVGKQSMVLPQKEFYLLYKLLSYPKRTFTRQELMDEIWGFDCDTDIRTVDVHIKRLREKFADLSEFDIVTVRGLGYKGHIVN